MVVGSDALDTGQINNKMLIINTLHIEFNYEKRHKRIPSYPIST
jgi:hypothetical protein